MGYEIVQNGNSQFAIDWEVVHRMLRSYWSAKLQIQRNYGREVTMSDSIWYNPMSWSLPDVSHIEVDWNSVRRDSVNYADGNLQEMRELAKYDAAGTAYKLEMMIGDAVDYKESFLDWMGTVQTQNMQKINTAVDNYQSQIEIAKWVRDTSADGIMVGASVLTGGAATAAVAGGSFLKGAFKFQDTGSVGAATMEAVGSFSFAAVKLGKKFSFREDMVVALVQSAWKTGTEVVGGATVGKAVLSGALKLTGPSVDKLFEIGPAKTLFDMVPVPIWVRIKGDTYQDKAAEVVSGMTAELVKSQVIEKERKSSTLRMVTPTQNMGSRDGAPSRQRTILGEATLTNKYLLYLAYVNMSKGIGRGW